MSELFKIHLDLDPDQTLIKGMDGEPLPGIAGLEVHQFPDKPPEAILHVELAPLAGQIFADQCAGKLDSYTVNMLKRLPPKLVAELAMEMAQLARDMRDTKAGAKRQIVGGESL